MPASGLPVVGALVRCRQTDQPGQVQGLNGERVRVRFATGTEDRSPQDLRSGLQPDHLVFHGPQGALPGLGEGRVVALRTLGGREQLALSGAGCPGPPSRPSQRPRFRPGSWSVPARPRPPPARQNASGCGSSDAP
jgi:hypothetical protein